MQPHDTPRLSSHISINRLRLATILVWTILAIFTTLWEYKDNKRFLISNALTTARACIEKDLTLFRWAAKHGDVYVTTTADTPANQWLDVPERDIITPSGKRLPLMNPAYMPHQLFDLNAKHYQEHLISLKSIRPENSPDLWESKVLKSFMTGHTEYGEFMIMAGKPVYRYIRALNTEQTCLKCHMSQGYRENAVRGGISMTIPTDELERSMRQSNINHISIIALTWLAGIGGIGLAFRKISSTTAALLEERDNLRSVFNATPMPMLLFDDRMEAVRVNSAFRDYCPDFDKLSDKWCGTILKCANAVPGSQACGNSPVCDSCHIVRALREVLRSGLPARGEASMPRFEYDKIITEATLLYSIEMVRLNKRNHALLSFMDITERTRMEEKLATSEREFRALVENSPDAIARYDRFCRRVYVNPALERMAGESADYLTGRTPLERPVVNQEGSQKIQTAVKQVLSQGSLVEIEFSAKDSSGTMRHSHIRFVPEFDTNGEVVNVLGITQDITSLRKTESQLLHVQKIETIGALAGGVAHDFNNLLAVIGGYAELLRLSCKDDVRNRAYAQQIADTVERGAELTRSLLTFSGKHEPLKQHDDLNQIVTNLRKIMSRLLRSDIALSFKLCDDRLPVFVDRGQIEQVLINLLVNARDSLTFDGHICVTTSLIEIPERNREQNLNLPSGCYGYLSVTDNGIGMNEDTIKSIFEPFFTTKEAGKGTGLGLAIVFNIIKNHSGCISVDSEPGKGSIFEVYLPLRKEHVPIHNQIPEPNVEIMFHNETVLVVDDDSIILRTTREILDSYGLTVLTAANGLEALQVFEENRNTIRVAVIDLTMPCMNGLTAIEEMRRQKPNLPIILTSGYTNDIVDGGIIAALHVTFLPKPIRPQKLVETIRTNLAG